MFNNKLYTKGRDGAIRFWQVSVEGDTVVTTHGVLGGASTIQRRKATPKNVGRANATSAGEQALLEAQAAYTHKLERKYSETPEDAQDVVPLPMLAKPFKNATYPVDTQRKLNGVRCIARWEGDKVALISRGGKYYTATPHIADELKKIMPKDSELDGELYVHGWTLQKIASRVKKAHIDSLQVRYHVYDYPTVKGDDSLPWWERREALHKLLLNSTRIGVSDIVKLVATYPANSYRQIKELHDSFVTDGYEGLIVRILGGTYEYGHRSPNLLKVKEFQDAEFKIIGAKEGEGTEAGAIIWECLNDINEKTFSVRPKGTHAERRALMKHYTDYIGTKLTVRFFDRTPDGLPFHPVGEAIRLEEDMD